MGPSVSVIVPAYQAAGTIGRTVRSCLSQALQDLEVVVADNLSDDGTELAARAVAAGDPRVVFIRQEQRLSVNAALNLCIAKARGRFLLFAPAHDILAPDCLGTLQGALEGDGGLSYAFGGFLFVGPSSSEARLQARPSYRRSGRKELVRLAAGGLTEACVTLMRMDAVREVGGFDEGLRRTNHWDLVSRLCLVGDVRYFRRVLGQYVFTGKHCSWREEIEERITLLDRHAAYFERAGIRATHMAKLREQLAWDLEHGLAYPDARDLSVSDRRTLAQMALGSTVAGRDRRWVGRASVRRFGARSKACVRAAVARSLTSLLRRA